MTAADKDFMEDLLGEIDTNPVPSSKNRTRPVKTEARRKTRVLSPPVSENRSTAVTKRTNGSDAHMPDTPPAANAYVDDDDLPVSLATLESQHIYTQGVLSTHIIESESA